HLTVCLEHRVVLFCGGRPRGNSWPKGPNVFHNQSTANRFNDRGRRPILALSAIVALIVVALVALAIVAWNGRDRTSALDDSQDQISRALQVAAAAASRT